MSWLGPSPQFFWLEQSLDAKSSELGAPIQPRSSGLCLPPSDAQPPFAVGQPWHMHGDVTIVEVITLHRHCPPWVGAVSASLYTARLAGLMGVGGSVGRNPVWITWVTSQISLLKETCVDMPSSQSFGGTRENPLRWGVVNMAVHTQLL